MIRRDPSGQSHREGRKLPRFVPGRLVIKWKPAAAVRLSASMKRRKTLAVLPSSLREPLVYLKESCGLRHVTPVFARRSALAVSAGTQPEAAAIAASLQPPPNLPTGLTVVEIDPGSDVQAVARRLSGGTIEYAEPAAARWVAEVVQDPRYEQQWGLPSIHWEAADRPDASDVRVAVLDSGVDRQHPDLKNAIAEYFEGDFSRTDLIGHGTHVSGIIAATVNNRIGIAGVANCRLYCWKVFGDEPADDGEIYLDDLAYNRALGDLIENEIRVVNLSIGGVQRSRTEADLMKRVVKAGVLVVAAMGNEFEDGNPKEYPAALPGVLAVGAIGRDGRRAPFSNTGSHVKLVAPGVGILSTLPRKASSVRAETEYARWDGTSMATPFVTGAAALVAARHPKWSGAKIRRHLAATAAWLDGMGPRVKKSSTYGAGELDLAAALGTR